MSYVAVDEKDVLPKPYEPDWDMLKVATSESPFSESSFYLLREATQLVAAIAGTKPKKPVTDRVEALLLGLAVKITKLAK